MTEASLQNLVLVRNGSQPVHHQLRAQLALQIRAGLLPGGARLPTVRALAVQLALNRNTVQKVYAALERAGLVVTRVGSGTVVAAGRADPAARIAEPLRDRLRQVIVEGLTAGLMGSDLRLLFESLLAEALTLRDTRAAELMFARRRFSGRPSYGSARQD